MKQYETPANGWSPMTARNLTALLLLLAACARQVRPTELPSDEARQVPAAEISADEGVASWYGAQFAGHPTANGEAFDPTALTAAHRTLPMGACVRVELISSGKSVEVRINDRGPFVAGRMIDLSEAAATRIGLTTEGVGRVRLRSCQ